MNTENFVFKKQQQASFFIIAMVMWEFFSYFGLQSILILYLTSQLHFSDEQAYQLYGSFTSLIFITPIIGGWLADRYCGYRYAAGLGCVLIILGHVVLGGLSHQSLYVGLALLTIGIGLFKSNAICLIGNCYPNDSSRKTAAFFWYYVSGNIGAVAGQLMCPYLVDRFNWDWGFMAAAFGMGLGLCMFYLSSRYFGSMHSIVKPNLWQKFSLAKKAAVSFLIISLLLMLMWAALFYNTVGWLLLATGAVSIIMLTLIYKKTNPQHKKSLLLFILLTAFATAFWVADQQGASSISLFIARYVNRQISGYTIPAGMFQSINPLSILLFGSIIALLWRQLAKYNIRPQADNKLSVAFALLILGFFVIAYGAKLAYIEGQAWMIYPIVGLFSIGVAELFVDPVLLTVISDIAPPHSEGQLVALYYLAVGAVANYLAIGVAQLTIDPTTNAASAATYYSAYMQVTYASIILFGLLLLRIMWRKRMERVR